MKKLLLTLLCATASVLTNATETTDEITSATLPATGSSYVEFSDITCNSNAVYCGKTAKNVNIQIQKSSIFLWTSTSGGNIKSISITYKTNTTPRNISVYASNTAYTTSTPSLSGDATATLSSTNLTWTPTENYQYFALKNATSNAAYIEKITIVWMSDDTAPKLEPAGLEFTESEKTVNIGEEFTLSVTNPNSLEVIYVSSNPEVATVDSNGTVKALAKGSTTITATSEATEEFEAGKAEYTLSVIDPNAPEQDYNFTVTGLTDNNAEVVFSPAANIATFTTAKNNSVNAPAFNTNGSDLRIYAKGSLTISVPEDVIVSKIVFNISTQGLVRLAPITASVGSIATQSSGDETVTWTGNVSNGKIELTVGDTADYGTENTKAGQLCFGSGIITAEFVKLPATPVIYVKDGDEITDGTIDLEKGTKTIVIAVAEGHELWYKVSEIDETVEAQNADTLADDFIKAETNPAEIELTKNGSVEYYSVLNGVSSPVQTLMVTGANTTAIAEVGAEANVAAEWFDMQGRRVAVPTKGGVYIIKQGSKTSKRAL